MINSWVACVRRGRAPSLPATLAPCALPLRLAPTTWRASTPLLALITHTHHPPPPGQDRCFGYAILRFPWHTATKTAMLMCGSEGARPAFPRRTTAGHALGRHPNTDLEPKIA